MVKLLAGKLLCILLVVLNTITAHGQEQRAHFPAVDSLQAAAANYIGANQ